MLRATELPSYRATELPSYQDVDDVASFESVSMTISARISRFSCWPVVATSKGRKYFKPMLGDHADASR
jgi:hypothetical protein